MRWVISLCLLCTICFAVYDLARGDEVSTGALNYSNVTIVKVSGTTIAFTTVGGEVIAKSLKGVANINWVGHKDLNAAEELVQDKKYGAAIIVYKEAIDKSTNEDEKALLQARLERAQKLIAGPLSQPASNPAVVTKPVIASEGAERCYVCNNTGKMECTACNGTGKMKCRRCKGSGRVLAYKKHEDEKAKCFSCNGTGLGDDDCGKCNGSKKIRCSKCASAVTPAGEAANPVFATLDVFAAALTGPKNPKNSFGWYYLTKLQQQEAEEKYQAELKNKKDIAYKGVSVAWMLTVSEVVVNNDNTLSLLAHSQNGNTVRVRYPADEKKTLSQYGKYASIIVQGTIVDVENKKTPGTILVELDYIGSKTPLLQPTSSKADGTR